MNAIEKTSSIKFLMFSIVLLYYPYNCDYNNCSIMEMD